MASKQQQQQQQNIWCKCNVRSRSYIWKQYGSGFD